MTAKDLNLVTDPSKLAAWAQQNSLQAQPESDEHTAEKRLRPRADLAAVPTTQATARRSNEPQKSALPVNSTRKQSPRTVKETRNRSHSAHGNLQWLLTAAVAVVNMLFIGLAALWLTGTDLKGSLVHSNTNNAAKTEAVIAAVQESNTQMASMVLELSTLKEQLNTLAIEVKKTASSQDQGTLPAASNPIVLPQTAEKAALLPPPIASAVTKPKTTTWQVNLGDYASRKEARQTQQILQNMGLQTQMNQLQANGTTAYLVSISGYADRQDAEDVANEIMSDTQLNGLWVAKTP